MRKRKKVCERQKDRQKQRMGGIEENREKKRGCVTWHSP